MLNYETRIELAKKAIGGADFILVGGGAGLSYAAGLKYTGKRFTDNFTPFIEKYGFEDLYTSSFYAFESAEERWAYWAKHISINRYEPPAIELYQTVYRLVKNTEHFVLTTNVEYQFHKAGFADEKVFMVQGDYGYFQCKEGCHPAIYNNAEQITIVCPQEDFADLVDRMDSYKRLYAAIDTLPEAQRRRLCLYYFAGLNYRQIAEMESVNQGTAAHSTERARKALAKLLNR